MEPLTAIGLAGNILQFVDFGTTVVLRLQKFLKHPNERLELFGDIGERLPLLLDTLGRMRTQIIQGNIRKSTQEALIPVVGGCFEQISQLKKILDKTVPDLTDSNFDRGLKALRSICNDKSVESISLKLDKYISILTFHSTISGYMEFTPAQVLKSDAVGSLSYEISKDPMSSYLQDYNRGTYDKSEGGDILGGTVVEFARLAGLFSTCLDVINKGDSYSDYAFESRPIVAQFEADKLLFQKWAQNVGIDIGKSKDTHHRDLDNPETALMVERILSSIQEIFSKTEGTISHLQPVSEAGPKSSQDNAPYSHGSTQNQKFQVPMSRRHRIGWALKGKAKFIAQIQQFGALVQRLHSLVPPDAIKRAVGMKTGTALDGLRNSSNGIYSAILTSECRSLFVEDYIHNAEWFSESQRILTEISKRLEGMIATCFVQRFTDKQSRGKERYRLLAWYNLD